MEIQESRTSEVVFFPEQIENEDIRDGLNHNLIDEMIKTMEVALKKLYILKENPEPPTFLNRSWTLITHTFNESSRWCGAAGLTTLAFALLVSLPATKVVLFTASAALAGSLLGLLKGGVEKLR